jgi:hypothetical protein
MTMPFHVKPFEKKFLRKWFSPQISSKPPSPQETKHIEKERRKKEKLQDTSNKSGSKYFERRKTF